MKNSCEKYLHNQRSGVVSRCSMPFVKTVMVAAHEAEYLPGLIARGPAGQTFHHRFLTHERSLFRPSNTNRVATGGSLFDATGKERGRGDETTSRLNAGCKVALIAKCGGFTVLRDREQARKTDRWPRPFENCERRAPKAREARAEKVLNP